MYKTFKTQLNPTKKQRQYFEKCFGTRRWTWNYLWFLNFNNKIPNYKYKGQNAYSHELVELAKTEEYKWLNDVNSMVRTETIKDFDNCMQRFFKDKKHHKLKPKKKNFGHESFRIVRKNERVFKFQNNKLTIVRVRNKSRLCLRTSEDLSFIQAEKIKSCTISKEAGKYYIYLNYETEKTNLNSKDKKDKIGLDLGIKHVAVAYDGKNNFVFDLPKSLFYAEKKTEKNHKKLSSMVYGSNRYNKQLIKLQKSYQKENNIKKDFRDKTVNFLMKNYNTVIVDDFNFENAKKLNINRHLLRVGSYLFKTKLEEKCNVIYIPKYTPTTQICSNCGCKAKEKILLNNRVYECKECGIKIDRDLNSAINTFNYV